MAKKSNQHVVPNAAGGWAIRRENAGRATAVLPTKRAAVERAREIASNQGVELVIHGRDGKIQSKDSHGNDPYPPAG